MKKRSLVAAIAMLVVSAIVLTSSTYAWFASNSSATVGTISANVSNNDGSLQVMATEGAVAGSTWKTALTDADYTGLPSSFSPVSMAMVSGAPSFYIANYDGTKFTATGSGSATANSQYIKYGFDVQYINGSTATPTIKITPTWSDTSDFCYGIVKVAVSGGSTTYYMFDTAGSYTPVTAVTGDIVDSKTTGTTDVIDSADANATTAASMGAYSTDVTQGTSGTAIQVTAAASDTTTIDVDVYIWAEGQDAQCSGTTHSGTASFSFGLGVE